MSVHETDELMVTAICKREDARDAFISNHFQDINALPPNAIIGTASPRRASLALSLRSDVIIKLLRGNVDTRLSKLDRKEYDAIILAAAGLHRLGLSPRIRSYLSDDFFTPAIGQGAIGIECRKNDAFIQDLLLFLNHTETAQCVTAERSVNRLLGGDCHTAIGAHAKIINNEMYLSAMVGSSDGQHIIRAAAQGNCNDATQIGKNVADILILKNAEKLIHHV
jgi:hydroxymethylbilane synthase